jgi:hypothetical protein
LPFGSRNTTFDFDVHGNQYQLLSQSKCFLQSKTMNCVTCHDPHTNAGADLNVYSQKCIDCHQDTDHKKSGIDKAVANTMRSNCIDCHMPLQPSRSITFKLPGSDSASFYLLRTHKIAVYQDEKINSLLQYFKKNKHI